MSQIKLTEYSHGAGCGCKIAPGLLEEILKTSSSPFTDSCLLVGNATKDDAAVPKLAEVENYITLGCSPDGAQLNFNSYGHKLGEMTSADNSAPLISIR